MAKRCRKCCPDGSFASCRAADSEADNTTADEADGASPRGRSPRRHPASLDLDETLEEALEQTLSSEGLALAEGAAGGTRDHSQQQPPSPMLMPSPAASQGLALLGMGGPGWWMRQQPNLAGTALFKKDNSASHHATDGSPESATDALHSMWASRLQ